MSRITYNEIDDVAGLMAAGRWERNSVTTLTSPNGRRALHAIEDALIALPEPMLYADTFCEVDGEDVRACVLGAVAWHRGLEVPETFNRYADDLGYDDPEEGAEEQARWAADQLGIVYTLAWNLIERNDETWGGMSPELRFTSFLIWVRRQLYGATRRERTAGVPFNYGHHFDLPEFRDAARATWR